MQMKVVAVGFAWREEIERLLYLFDDDLQLSWEDCLTVSPNIVNEQNFTLKIEFQERPVWAKATLIQYSNTANRTTVEYVAVAEADDDSGERNGKHYILRTVHDVMQQMMGAGQPWGILTGVRPLKLVHARLEKGQSISSILHELQDEYRISAERAALMTEIAGRQLTVLPDLYQIFREVSVYIGIPFCPTHCAYCTFPAYSMTEKRTYATEFLRALDFELKTIGEYLRQHGIRVTSVYVGGGTPTSLDAKELDFMLNSVRREIPGDSSWREFTVEAGRPDTITPDRVKVMRNHGVNRISVNPQTFKAETLKQIGRGHTPDIVDRRFHLVREAGFTNINMDIILGLPDEDLSDVADTRARIVALRPDSVTVHTMSFKRTAVVNREKARFEIPHKDLVHLMMKETIAWARQQGYNPYYLYRQRDILGNLENIGFATSGKESIYNIAIMEERQCIIGAGGGASTKMIGSSGKSYGRHGNPREPRAYVESIERVIQKKIQLLDELYSNIEK